MKTYAEVLKWFLLVLACGSLTTVSYVYMSKGEAPDKYENSITVTARGIKDVDNLIEPIPLVISIANHSLKPAYILIDESGFLDLTITVEDANGARIRGDPVPSAPPPPPYYYMKKDGKKVFTVPVVKVEPGQSTEVTMPDALKRYHNNLQVGHTI